MTQYFFIGKSKIKQKPSKETQEDILEFAKLITSLDKKELKYDDVWRCTYYYACYLSASKDSYVVEESKLPIYNELTQEIEDYEIMYAFNGPLTKKYLEEASMNGDNIAKALLALAPEFNMSFPTHYIDTYCRGF